MTELGKYVCQVHYQCKSNFPFSKSLVDVYILIIILKNI